MLIRRLLGLPVCILLLLPCLSLAGSTQPGARDKCAVCGMFVAKYPAWSASLTFKDGRTEFFDGAKDLFRFYQGLSRYAPRRNPSEIREMRVKDYYTLDTVDSRNAWYVIGSDVPSSYSISIRLWANFPRSMPQWLHEACPSTAPVAAAGVAADCLPVLQQPAATALPATAK